MVTKFLFQKDFVVPIVPNQPHQKNNKYEIRRMKKTGIKLLTTN